MELFDFIIGSGHRLMLPEHIIYEVIPVWQSTGKFWLRYCINKWLVYSNMMIGIFVVAAKMSAWKDTLASKGTVENSNKACKYCSHTLRNHNYKVKIM